MCVCVYIYIYIFMYIYRFYVLYILNMFCFGKVLKSKDNVCNLKPFAQSHLLFCLLICCCL